MDKKDWVRNHGREGMKPMGSGVQIWELDLRPLALGRITGTVAAGWSLELITLTRVFVNHCAFRDLEEAKQMVEVMAADKAQAFLQALGVGFSLLVPSQAGEQQGAEAKLMPHQERLLERLRAFGIDPVVAMMKNPILDDIPFKEVPATCDKPGAHGTHCHCPGGDK